MVAGGPYHLIGVSESVLGDTCSIPEFASPDAGIWGRGYNLSTCRASKGQDTSQWECRQFQLMMEKLDGLMSQFSCPLAGDMRVCPTLFPRTPQQDCSPCSAQRVV